MCKELIDFFNAEKKVKNLETSLCKAKENKEKKWRALPDSSSNTLIEINEKLYFFDGTFNEVNNGY